MAACQGSEGMLASIILALHKQHQLALVIQNRVDHPVRMIDRAHRPYRHLIICCQATASTPFQNGGNTMAKVNKTGKMVKSPKECRLPKRVSPDAVRPTIVTTVPLRGKLKTSSRLMSPLPTSPRRGLLLASPATRCMREAGDHRHRAQRALRLGIAASRSIRCFTSEPSVASSLEVLAQTPARDKVESLYLFMLRDIRHHTPVHNSAAQGSRQQGQLPTRTDIDVVHQDEHLLVPNKSPGLLSVPGRGEDNRTASPRPAPSTHRSFTAWTWPCPVRWLMARSRPCSACSARNLKPALWTSSTSPWSMAAGGAPQ
jgi:hypothetical protein